MASDNTIREALEGGLNVYEQKANRRLLDRLETRFANQLREERDHEEDDGEEQDPLHRRLYRFLKAEVLALLHEIAVLRKRYSEYTKRYSRATTMEDRERHILEFARDMGAGPKDAFEDERAFGRWFDHDAIVDRLQLRTWGFERMVTFVLERIGFLAERELAAKSLETVVTGEWRRLDLEATLKPFFHYEGDARVVRAAFRALARALSALAPELRERSVAEGTLRFIYRSAMSRSSDPWLQCEAITILEELSDDSFSKVLAQRLLDVAGGDDIFVRRRAVRLLGRSLGRLPNLRELVPIVMRDSSPFVRQGLAQGLEEAPGELALDWLKLLAVEDAAPQVRAAALLTALRFLARADLQDRVLGCLESVLKREKDEFVRRVALKAAVDGARLLAEFGSGFREVWAAECLGQLEKLHHEAEKTPTRRQAALAREALWSVASDEARDLLGLFSSLTDRMDSGTVRRLVTGPYQKLDPDVLGRVLSVLAHNDFGYDVDFSEKQVLLYKGFDFGFRPWRWLHELRTPSPDKRQAFRHTIGRHYRGNLRAPSAIVAELAETRVPGEPLFLSEEGGWRPYLPLLDEVLSALRGWRRGSPARIYTAEGVTEIVPPSRFLDRLLARYRITTEFAHRAHQRNWSERSSESPGGYVEELQRLGIEIRFRPHSLGDDSLEPEERVSRFFPGSFASLGWLGLEDFELFDRVYDYFLSVYDNSVAELAVFTLLAGALFVGKHLHANAIVRRTRDNIPLVVGGWGTRGKSGTERLKAALFSALGYGVVCKTTGCEAMFLYAHPFGDTREMFLFRSYDKATIWEQEHVMRIADELGAEVFLWECMALTPAYVELLQRHWVRDDLSTITNTYPDHEDLQGPAGINVPEVISLFIPRQARVVTTEDWMYPILEEQARRFETDIRQVTWLEIGLLTPDVLQRFPYDEHPNNVALVLALAEELGVDKDFALKEMADRVVADLGVLKTSPVAPVRGRRLTFTNGCSANEKHGAMGNWLRTGFAVQDPVAEPGVWITTVVNNRADRVPRSQVFARLVLEEFQADRHFLIGGNLQGLTGYIHEAWGVYRDEIQFDEKGGAARIEAKMREVALRMRLPVAEEHVERRVRAMLEGFLGEGSEEAASTAKSWRDPDALAAAVRDRGVEDADDLLRYAAELREDLAAFEAQVAAVAERDVAALESSFRDFVWERFEKKLVVVEDYYISGEQLVDLIARETPPGYLNRIMGLQNIKGTGLDFVYRWQAWEACHRACTQLRDRDPAVAEKGLRTLSSFREFGVLSEEFVRATLDEVGSSPAAQNESFQAELALIQANFTRGIAEVRAKMSSVRKKGGWYAAILASVEGFFDAGDAIRRRKTADRIYKDLVTQRISGDRAARELQWLMKRQKGGWLQKRLAEAIGRGVKTARAVLLRAVKAGSFRRGR